MDRIVYASSDIGGLIVMAVVFITVIAQIVKGTRQFKGNRPGEGQPQRPGRSPEEELRDFLESLTGNKAPPAETPAEPPPLPPAPVAPRAAPAPAPRSRPPARPMHVRPQTARPRPATPPPMPPPTFTPVLASSPVLMPAAWEVVSHHEDAFAEYRSDHTVTARHRRAVVAELHNRRATRQAYLLRVILGPCVALR